MLLLPLAFVAAALPSVLGSNLVILDSANFTDVIGHGTPALVEFYAPWCGHCKSLAPIYEKLADVLAHAKDKIIVAQVDADGPGREVGTKHGVTGFPTLKWFNGDSSEEGVKYEGGRELEDFANFIREKTGAVAKIKLPPPPATTIVDNMNFNEIVMDEDKDVFIAFTAPWCGHCKALKPHLEKLALDFKPDLSVVVAMIDADASQNRDLGSKYDVKAYPSMKFFPKGSKTDPIDYTGAPNESAMVSFLNERSGTHRTVGGGLNDFAGRVGTLDALAQKLFTAVPTSRAEIYEEAVAVAEAAGSTGEYYLKVMKKLLDGPEEYVTKEAKRLKSILDKRSAPQQKLDEVTRKLNVLSAFVQEKVEEAVQAVKEEL